MATFEATFESLQGEMKKLGLKYDEKLFRAVTKGCGPAIYNKDARSVSCGDAAELATVKKNFLMKKLGMKDSPKLDTAIQGVCEKMGKSNRNKYRAIFYYLLVEELGGKSKFK